MRGEPERGLQRFRGKAEPGADHLGDPTRETDDRLQRKSKAWIAARHWTLKLARHRRRVRPLVGQRQRDADECDAVRNCVMDAGYDGGAAVIVLDDVELPERMRRVEGLRDKVGYEALEIGLKAAPGQPHPLDMVGYTEMRVFAPPGAGTAGLDTLTEPAEGEKPFRQRAF